MTSPTTAAERHLVALWGSVRDAHELLGRGGLDMLMERPELVGLLRSLATDMRQLSDGLLARIQPAPRAIELVRNPDDKPRLLLVGDSSRSLDSLKQMLGEDFELASTNHATHAVKLAREEPCDAVVTDLRMPGVDGLALLDLLRVSSMSPAPPLLVVADPHDARHRHPALERGVFDFLVRPLERAELVARLQSAVLHGQELQREHNLQLTDDLTGLLNRRALNVALREALQRSAEHGSPIALALVDQDGLKQINDRWGHAAGDKAIVAVARALSAVRRSTDVVVRQGGDEFAVLMPNTSIDGAHRMLERAEVELQQNPIEVAKGVMVRVRISFGISSCAASVTTGEALLAAADTALYAMKRQKAA
ncbi:MAG: diguanylate cyclase [Archangiaceae bacterium]|nr:diguanylate cyclase [Archangiaceae bacterium]